MSKTIWMPHLLGNYGFEIYLDATFAREMVQSKISEQVQDKMNELANAELKQLGVNWTNPYNFYEQTPFISQFYLGQNGVWLSTGIQDIKELFEEKQSSNSIVYRSHNVDTSKQIYVLMSLFDKWVEYAPYLKTK